MHCGAAAAPPPPLLDLPGWPGPGPALPPPDKGAPANSDDPSHAPPPPLEPGS